MGKARPIFKEIVVKNPKTLFPVNWEEILDEDRYWYDYEPKLDENGDVITVKNIYVVFKKLVGFCKTKNNSIKFKQKPLFELKGEKEDEKK